MVDRYVTGEAVSGLVSKLALPAPDAFSQDWEHEIDCTGRIHELIEAYDQRPDLSDDERFALMKVILSSCDELLSRMEAAEDHWTKIEGILRSNWSLHECTIHYWCVWENAQTEDCFAVTPRLRALVALNTAALRDQSPPTTH